METMTREPTALDPETRTHLRLSTAVALIAAVAAGCAAEVDGHEVEATLAAHDHTGPTDIAGAQEYLQKYGYLPSDELRQRVPNAKIIVDEPFERGALDLPTRAALTAFQTNSGLAATGEFDGATRAKMAAVRCGNIDAPVERRGLPGEDGLEDKFALKAKLTRGSAIIRLINTPTTGGATTAKVNADVDAAALEYRRKTGFYMQRSSSTTNPGAGQWAIDLYFYSGARPSWAHEKCPSFVGSPAAAVTVSWAYASTGEQFGPIPICVNTATNFS